MVLRSNRFTKALGIVNQLPELLFRGILVDTVIQLSLATPEELAILHLPSHSEDLDTISNTRNIDATNTAKARPLPHLDTLAKRK